jgi:hypothetical protein
VPNLGLLMISLPFATDIGQYRHEKFRPLAKYYR